LSSGDMPVVRGGDVAGRTTAGGEEVQACSFVGLVVRSDSLVSSMESSWCGTGSS